MDDRDQMGSSRRAFLASTVGITGSLTASSIVSGTSSNETKSEKKGKGVKENNKHPTVSKPTLVDQGDKYKLYETSVDGERIQIKIYLNKDGSIQKVTRIHQDSSQSRSNGSEAVNNSSGGVSTQSISVGGIEIGIFSEIEKFHKTLNLCDTDYCNGFTYRHVMGGHHFTLTNAAKYVGTASIGAALGSAATLLGFATTFITDVAGGIAAIISSKEGNKFTYAAWDVDVGSVEGLESPNVRRGAAVGYTESRDDFTTLPNAVGHLSKLDGRCGTDT